MRPMWTGSISFGLLQVPVQLFTATRDLDLHFRMLDGRDQKPIRYERVNVETGQVVPWKEVVKAYEVKKGNYLVVDEEEIKKAAPKQTATIEIEAFVDRAEVDPIYFEKPYYVAPGKNANKSYVLLREALEKSGRIGIARVVIRTKEYLAALHPEKNALMLTLMRFDQELVEPKTVGLTEEALGNPTVRPAELEMAQKLLESMSTKWKPGDYKDQFRTKLRDMLERRAKHGKMVTEPEEAPTEEAEATNVIDLVSILEKSLAKTEPHRRAAGASTASPGPGKGTAKRAAPRRARARKTSTAARRHAR